MDNNSSEEIDDNSGDEIENKGSLSKIQRPEETKNYYKPKFDEFNEDEKVLESKQISKKEKDQKDNQENSNCRTVVHFCLNNYVLLNTHLAYK